MKVNKIDYDNILCYEEFIDKYGKELKESTEKGDISQEVIDNLVSMIIEYDDWRKDKYIMLIERIYISIIEVKYLEMDRTIPLEESIYKLIRYIYCLKSDMDFTHREEYWNREELCNKAYNNLLENGVDTKYLKEEMEEDFKPEHLLDIDYHLNNFKKYIKNEEVLKDLDNTINYAWRRMI